MIVWFIQPPAGGRVGLLFSTSINPDKVAERQILCYGESETIKGVQHI